MNTTLQTYLFDFIYDQQDLYEFYDSQIKDEKNNQTFLKTGKVVKVKNIDLPFADSLENLGDIFREFASQEDREALFQSRWYLPNDKGLKHCFIQESDE